ncbi:MAG TPA: hypothetical protein VKP11_04500 [Frankiaceae bacterium]|nr:hypothetical protein [Frankiaceae bacterium]
MLPRHRLPAELRARLTLEPHEWLDGYARVDGEDGYALASDLGLRLAPSYTLVRWEDVDGAVWREPELRVVADDGRRWLLRLVDGEHLADVIRVRVENSIVVSRHRRLRPDGRGVRIVARQRSDTGAVVWALRYDRGLDPADPALRAAGEALLGEVQAELGP